MVSIGIIPLSIISLAWTLAAYKSYKLCVLWNDPKSRSLRPFCLAVVSLALSVTLLIPSLYMGIDALTGIPNLSRLLMHGCGTIAGFGFQAHLIYLSNDSKEKRK